MVASLHSRRFEISRERSALVWSLLLAMWAAAGFAATDGGEEDSPLTKTATLQDESTTTALHSDTTILRNVDVTTHNARGELTFGPLNVWAGGTVQYDTYYINGLLNHGSGGSGDGGQQIRRMQGVLRSRLLDWGELKFQYDFKQRSIDDFYLRWVSRLTRLPFTVTLGNQKEPMGLDNLTGSAFTTAQELPAPEAAFADWRSMGLLVHRAFRLAGDEREISYFKGREAAVTASLGVFTQDLERTNDTSLAVTGRLTMGQSEGDKGTHLGAALSLREARGSYDWIQFRPEIKEADRIKLAQPDADQLVIAALEGARAKGPFTLQGEVYLADYIGDVDGDGAGAYLQASWFVTGENRQYLADWGVFAPMRPPPGGYIVELFGRTSYVRGEDDQTGWNTYGALTLGGNVYYRRFKVSVNTIYGATRDRIDGEKDGVGVDFRVQLLF